MTAPITEFKNFYLDVVRGVVDGYSTRELVGLNAAVGGTEDIWNYGGSITQSATAALLYVSSSDALDTTTHKLTITGLDANYNTITEIVTMAGQTVVPTTKAFLRVNSVTSNLAANGTCYVYYYNAVVTAGVPQTASTIQAIINIGALQAYNAIYTVPRDKNLYFTSMRYASTASSTTHDVIISITRKVYGGSLETVESIKYVDLGSTDYVDRQFSVIDQPIFFPAKSEIRLTAGLSGGTALNISVLINFIEESLTVTPSATRVYDMKSYVAAYSAPTISCIYYLIGLDELPVTLPITANLLDTLTTITGQANYSVAADTEVAFDVAVFTSGKLVQTTKKAVLSIVRCIDNAAAVYYVLAPNNTMYSLGGVKKVSYLKF